MYSLLWSNPFLSWCRPVKWLENHVKDNSFLFCFYCYLAKDEVLVQWCVCRQSERIVWLFNKLRHYVTHLVVLAIYFLPAVCYICLLGKNISGEKRSKEGKHACCFLLLLLCSTLHDCLQSSETNWNVLCRSLVCPHSLVWRSVSVVQAAWRFFSSWGQVVECGLGSVPSWHIHTKLYMRLTVLSVVMLCLDQAWELFWIKTWLVISDRLVGLVVKASALRAEGPGFQSHLRLDFFGVESYQWLQSWHSSGYPARPWRYRVSTGTGWPGVSILWLGEVESLICNFYLSVAARKLVWADPSLRYTSLLLER